MSITAKQQMKLDICKKHSSYLELIYLLGKGVMQLKHLQSYMLRIEKHSNSTVYNNLKDLEEQDIIEITRYHNNNYIKLKRYAIHHVTNRDIDNISSVKITNMKIHRSIMYNEFVLLNYKSLMKNYNSVSDLIMYLFKVNTLFYNDKEIYKFFELNMSYKHVNEESIKNEIINLKNIHMNQRDNLRRIESTRIADISYFNINNMQSRDIHIVNMIDDAIRVRIFDVHDNYDYKKLLDNMIEVVNYLSSFFAKEGELLNYEFILFVIDKDSEYRVIKYNDLIRNKLDNKGLLHVNYKVIDLNLTATAFNNKKILN